MSEVDLSKPSLRGLIWLLRNPSAWPEDFRWNYETHMTCACGLASIFWGTGEMLCSADVARMMRMEVKANQFRRILADADYAFGDKSPSAEWVADKLEELING